MAKSKKNKRQPATSSASSSTHESSHTPARMLINKLPRARPLIGDDTYDIDVRFQGEAQPLLEGTTVFSNHIADTSLALGRQIAVNGTYLCHATVIRNVKKDLTSVLSGHDRNVSDMAFFAEDVHLLASASIEGRVFVREIGEKPDKDGKPQIFENIILDLQIKPLVESFNPRVCWHPQKQEILMLALGKNILKIDINSCGKGERFTSENPRILSMDKLINGLQLVGEHDGEVTELSMCLGMTSFLASASIDGTVKIWEDHNRIPLVTLTPYDGDPVNSVAFLTRPDHFVLITGGPRNQCVKIWASERGEGQSLHSDAETWQCTQTLTLKSSSESDCDAFFNKAVALPSAGLFLLANAKKNALYAVHIKYDSRPAAPKMDYIGEFTVSMPILSLTGTIDTLPTGEHVVQVYCVQTNVNKQYALDLSQCLPQPDGAFSPSKSPINSIDSSAEVSCSAGATLSMQKEIHKQMSALEKNMKEMRTLFQEYSKHGKLEGDCITNTAKKDLPADLEKELKKEIAAREALERKMEKTIQDNTDALRAHFQEENTKRDKLEGDRMQQIRNEITSLRAALEKTQKEIAAIAPSVALEKAISSYITESFQKGAGAKPSLNTTEHLMRLIDEDKYEEAFTEALEGNDLLVSWLCWKVDFHKILHKSPLQDLSQASPPPDLSQPVLLNLLYRLASALSTQTLKKIGWMTVVTLAIDLKDSSIAVNAKPLFEQVRMMLDNHIPETYEEQDGIRRLKRTMHWLSTLDP